MTEVLRPLALVAGAALVLLILADAIATLIVTRARTARWRPTRLWYATTWRCTRVAAARLPTRGGDFVLNVYPALSLLGLLLIWLVGLMVGWAFVYWGLAERVAGQGDWVSLAYYSGTSLLTPTFGVASGEGVRFLSLVETLSGLGTIALLISYLPALYGAYSRREARLLTLDDPIGGRLTPLRVIAVHASDQSLDLFNRFCADWEMSTAEVLESHTSYPMLALLRSQHPGQSWITVDIAAALNIPEAPADIPALTRENVEIAWDELNKLGLELRDKDETWRRLQELRGSYGNRLQELIDYTLAPHGFWGHSAEATVVEEVARATAEARFRARGRGHRASLPG